MLANLFSVELWERFSFYGMQGILLYYMYFSVAEGGLAIDREIATGLVGAYGGGVYLSTILGAWLADRILGSERVLFYSAIIIMLGHLSLAVLPGAIGLTAGLVLVGVGSGGLKANATSLVGTLYEQGDERRDAGFSIFYMGINIGALVGHLITAWLQHNGASTSGSRPPPSAWPSVHPVRHDPEEPARRRPRRQSLPSARTGSGVSPPAALVVIAVASPPACSTRPTSRR